MNKSELIETLTKLTEMDDVAGIRKLIRRNPEMNNMNCRELNEDFIINNHRFVKRNGQISLIKDETRYPNAKNAVFVGSYQTKKNLDSNDNQSISSNLSKLNDSNEDPKGLAPLSKLLREDNQSISSMNSLESIPSGAGSFGANLTDLNDDACSIQSNLIDLNEMDNNNEYTLIIEQQQQQINELTNKVGCFMNEVKEQIEYIKGNIEGLGRNFINFANAYNNDLEPRTRELEQITSQMKQLLSNFV